MKKILRYLFFAVAALMLAACQKPDEEPLHTDNTIHEIMMYSTSTPEELDGRPTPQPVSGIINQETGEIKFPVSRDYRPRKTPEGKTIVFYDFTRVKLRASVGYDVEITPPLTGIHDISEGMDVEVLAVQTGEVKHYSIRAYFLRD